MNAWFLLILAALFEVGWPLGFKLSQTHQEYRIVALLFSIVSMVLSGYLLFLAQKIIPIGTAYAVWTGIGCACTFLIGVFAFGDLLNLSKCVGIILIILGVILLKI